MTVTDLRVPVSAYEFLKNNREWVFSPECAELVPLAEMIDIIRKHNGHPDPFENETFKRLSLTSKAPEHYTGRAVGLAVMLRDLLKETEETEATEATKKNELKTSFDNLTVETEKVTNALFNKSRKVKPKKHAPAETAINRQKHAENHQIGASFRNEYTDAAIKVLLKIKDLDDRTETFYQYVDKLNDEEKRQIVASALSDKPLTSQKQLKVQLVGQRRGIAPDDVAQALVLLALDNEVNE